MLFLRRKIKVVVHSGTFHPDDVFAVAILSLYLKKPIQVIRSRDPKDWAEADYVCDVGLVYDPALKRFDHHQKGWDVKRENGILYAACGLVWKEYGEAITGSKEIADKIDRKIIQPIDANDNAIELYKPDFEGISEYSYGDHIFSYNHTWREKKIDTLKTFNLAAAEAKKCLEREIKRAQDSLLSKQIVKQLYEKSEDKRLIILDDEYSYQSVLGEYSEPLFVVKPVFENNTWHVSAINTQGVRFHNRLDLPESWAGKQGKELAEITGVSDAIFCHNGRFVAAAKSKEGAIALAKLALANA